MPNSLENISLFLETVTYDISGPEMSGHDKKCLRHEWVGFGFYETITNRYSKLR